MLEFQTDSELLQEAQTNIKRLNCELEQLELEQLLSDPYDQNGAYLIINAGNDELDAQDWAEMLLKMYHLWGQKGGYQVRLVGFSQEDYIGIKSAILQIEGRYVYGYLKSETGTHQLRRISPFNITKTRPTTATVEVTPMVDLEIPEKCLEIKHAYSNVRNINGMGTWVQIVHTPTGISVTSREERSQRLNKEKALAIIKSRLFAIAQRQFVADISEIKRDRIADIFTHPIRDYAFYPSQIVKDRRSGFETNAVAEVLAGELNPLIKAYLRINNEGNG